MVGSGNYQAAPGGTPWTFSSDSHSGIAGNGSGYNTYNPPAPEGAQVAYLQFNGWISQSVANWSAGSYVISFDAAQRSTSTGTQQDQNFEVLVDGTVVGVYTPGGPDYATYTTPAFNVATGSHTIEFLALDSATGDNTALVDNIQIRAATLGLGDAGFESPSVASDLNGFQVAPTGTPWTFSGDQAGFASNGSAFNNPPAPEGTQVAFLQKTGAMTQTVQGWTAGTYILSFDAAQRDEPGLPVQHQDFEVVLDGSTILGTFTPSSASFAVDTTAPFTVAAGSHTIEFVGLNNVPGYAGLDNTAFIDAVHLTQVTADHLYYSAQGQVIEERLGGTAASDVQTQYVWGAGYVNELVLRDTYSGGVEQASQRLYAQWNANYNVTALVNTSGQVVERYLYDPYGAVTVLNASWTPVAGNTSAYGWIYLFQGGRLDTVTERAKRTGTFRCATLP